MTTEIDDSNWMRICRLLVSRGHKIEFEVSCPKHYNISMRFDALIGDHIILMKRGKFPYQLKSLQDAGFAVYITPRGQMSTAEIKSFCDMVEQKDGNGRT